MARPSLSLPPSSRSREKETKRRPPTGRDSAKIDPPPPPLSRPGDLRLVLFLALVILVLSAYSDNGSSLRWAQYGAGSKKKKNRGGSSRGGQSRTNRASGLSGGAADYNPNLAGGAGADGWGEGSGGLGLSEESSALEGLFRESGHVLGGAALVVPESYAGIVDLDDVVVGLRSRAAAAAAAAEGGGAAAAPAPPEREGGSDNPGGFRGSTGGGRAPVPFENARYLPVPLYWHVSRTAGTSVKDVMGTCLGLIQASSTGVEGDLGSDHASRDELYVVRNGGGKYVNVDTSTPGGLERCRALTGGGWWGGGGGRRDRDSPTLRCSGGSVPRSDFRGVGRGCYEGK